MSDGDLILLPEADGLPHRLGRNVNHDPLNRRWMARMVDATAVKSKRHRYYGLVLGQGGLGACVPSTALGCLNTVGLRRIGKVWRSIEIEGWYSIVTAADPFAGQWKPDDTGSDGGSMGKVLRDAGLIKEWRWTFGITAFRQALMLKAMMVGIGWTESMFHPDARGRLQIVGGDVGGHEFMVRGYDLPSDEYYCQNSWTSQWGLSGHFILTGKQLAERLEAGGDATQLIA